MVSPRGGLPLGRGLWLLCVSSSQTSALPAQTLCIRAAEVQVRSAQGAVCLGIPAHIEASPTRLLPWSHSDRAASLRLDLSVPGAVPAAGGRPPLRPHGRWPAPTPCAEALGWRGVREGGAGLPEARRPRPPTTREDRHREAARSRLRGPSLASPRARAPRPPPTSLLLLAIRGPLVTSPVRSRKCAAAPHRHCQAAGAPGSGGPLPTVLRGTRPRPNFLLQLLPQPKLLLVVYSAARFAWAFLGNFVLGGDSSV